MSAPVMTCRSTRAGVVRSNSMRDDASYVIQVYLNSGTQTKAEIDANNRYEVKVPMKAGLRTVGVSFRET